VRSQRKNTPQIDDFGPIKIVMAHVEYVSFHVKFIFENTGPETVVIVKAKYRDCQALRGAAVIVAQLQLYCQPAAPVVRLAWAMSIPDDVKTKKVKANSNIELSGGDKLSGETFFNVVEPGDSEALDLLTTQERLTFHFFASETNEYIYSKEIKWGETQRLECAQIKSLAIEHFETGVENFDFMLAKESVMNETEI